MYGSLHMGIGYALTEDFEAEGGVILRQEDERLRRAALAPDAGDGADLRRRSGPRVPVRCPRRRRDRPGADGPCIAGALYRYDGIVRTQLPMRDSPAAQAITKPKARRQT